MIILGEVTEVVDESKLSITWYHRVPIGLERGTFVYLVLLPKLTTIRSHNMAEVILTPIDPESWGDLWKIRCKFHEKPGVVSGLLDFLAEKNINILIQESVTTQQNRTHFVSIIGDFRDYGEGVADSTWRRIDNKNLLSLSSLEREIAIIMIEHIVMEGGEPAVTVTRMQNFYEAFFSYRRYNPLAFNPAILTVSKNGVIIIDESLLIEAIKAQLWQYTDDIPRPNLELRQVILNTHTEDRYISLLFPHPSAHLATFTIVHHERIGALAAIAKIIKDLNINILSSFNRLQKMGLEAHWNVILDIGDRDIQQLKYQILEQSNQRNQNLIKSIDERPMIQFGREYKV